MRARPRHLHMSSDFAQGHRHVHDCCEGGCGTSAQGSSTPWVALDLMDFFYGDPQNAEDFTAFDTGAAPDCSEADQGLGVLQLRGRGCISNLCTM